MQVHLCFNYMIHIILQKAICCLLFYFCYLLLACHLPIYYRRMAGNTRNHEMADKVAKEPQNMG